MKKIPTVFGYDPDAILADPQAHPINKFWGEVHGSAHQLATHEGDPR